MSDIMDEFSEEIKILAKEREDKIKSLIRRRENWDIWARWCCDLIMHIKHEFDKKLKDLITKK
jgi:hypothetical protein